MTYNSGKLINKGTIDLYVPYNDKKTKTTFYVVDTLGPAIPLGLPILRNLNLVSINCQITIRA